MKIGLCQINPIVGNFSGNKSLILESYEKMVEKGADLIVFPELVVTGYPPQDLLFNQTFIEENLAVVKEIAEKTSNPAIIGFVDEQDGKLFNAAALCNQGRIESVYHKILLPTYDVFDEWRYFSPGMTPGIWSVTINGQSYKLGIQICEDLWDDDYPVEVTEKQVELGADFIVNISASPYHTLRIKERMALIQEKVKKTGKPFIYCNIVGCQDELIFDGQSVIYNHENVLIGYGQAFKTDLVVADLWESQGLDFDIKTDESEEMYRALSLGVRDYFKKTGHKEALVGLSGGIDSAIVACIAADALGPEKVHGISMPSKYSSDHSMDDARTLAENLGIDFQVIPIGKLVQAFELELDPLFRDTEPNVAEENIQARCRGNLLMAVANKFNWLVLSTGNKTEMALGYCTLYGDMSGGLSVISDVSKTMVYALANWINQSAGKARIPVNSIEKPPSAELKADQVDPFDYDLVSPLVDKIVQDQVKKIDLIENGYDPDLVEDIYRRIRINEYKRRQAAIGFRVSRKAFGLGRRVPVINHFDG